MKLTSDQILKLYARNFKHKSEYINNFIDCRHFFSRKWSARV